MEKIKSAPVLSLQIEFCNHQVMVQGSARWVTNLTIRRYRRLAKKAVILSTILLAFLLRADPATWCQWSQTLQNLLR